MSVLPEQLARLLLAPIGRERVEDQRASHQVEILHDGKLANVSITRSLVDMFFKCTGTLFYIFTPEESSKLFQAVYANPNVVAKSSIGALYALVCVASQYDDLHIDPALRLSYYDTSKFYLDDCIEEDVLLGMQTLCCLAIYCVMDKRLTAWTWVLTGLKLARLRGIHLEERPSSTPPEQWIAQKKVMRTLIFLASWLSSTLGSNPEIVAAFRPGFEENFSVVETNPSVESVAQEQMTAVGVLSAGVLREVFLPDALSLVSTRKHQAKLLHWIRNLPPTMQFGSLSQDNGLTVGQRRSIYLIHLNSLGALLLLYRRHLFYLSTRQKDGEWTLDGEVEEALRYADDAVDVATHTARLVHLLLAEKIIFKRCWLVIYQSFSACAVLLFYVAQTRLHGAPGSQYEEELSHAADCLAALEFCAQGDAVAKGYHSMLAFYYTALRTGKDNSSKNAAADSVLSNEINDSDTNDVNPLPERLSQRHLDGVSEILSHPFNYGWPANATERAPNASAATTTGSYTSAHDTDTTSRPWYPDPTYGNVYADSPVLGGPFQWSANTIPPYNKT